MLVLSPRFINLFFSLSRLWVHFVQSFLCILVTVPSFWPFLSTRARPHDIFTIHLTAILPTLSRQLRYYELLSSHSFAIFPICVQHICFHLAILQLNSACLRLDLLETTSLYIQPILTCSHTSGTSSPTTIHCQLHLLTLFIQYKDTNPRA